MQLTAMNYYGGKARREHRNWLLPKIPYDKNGIYIEPFAGMLGVLLARPQSALEVINDLDPNIANWWRVVRENPNELKHLIQYTPRCRRTVAEAGLAIQNKIYHKYPIKWAWATYTILEYGASHGINGKGYSPRFTKVIERDFTPLINPLSERVKDVEIENVDALIILDRFKNVNNALIYCDPPYLTANTQTYGCDGKDINVDTYTKMLLAQKGKVAISGYRDEWDHLGWQRFEWDTKARQINHVTEYEPEKWKRTECLWTNYEIGGNQLELEI